MGGFLRNQSDSGLRLLDSARTLNRVFSWSSWEWLHLPGLTPKNDSRPRCLPKAGVLQDPSGMAGLAGGKNGGQIPDYTYAEWSLRGAAFLYDRATKDSTRKGVSEHRT